MYVFANTCWTLFYTRWVPGAHYLLHVHRSESNPPLQVGEARLFRHWMAQAAITRVPTSPGPTLYR